MINIRNKMAKKFEYDKVLDTPVKVDDYNITDMKAQNWKFYIGGKRVSKKMVLEGLDLGIHNITAVFKRRD